MRRDVDAERLRAFLRALGASARAETTVYLTGGATALLYGWRPGTIGVDLKLEPDRDEILRAFPRLKEELVLNVELTSPDGFLPELPGWRDRSPYVTREGLVTVRHYDLYAQALAKLERGHARPRYPGSGLRFVFSTQNADLTLGITGYQQYTIARLTPIPGWRRGGRGRGRW